MYQIDFQKPLHIHFIGIGGISMSGLAEILMGEGFTVSGSDAKESPLTKSLEAKGAKIFYGQRASNIMDSTEAVVYTAAIHSDNPEFAKAKEKNLPMLTRAQLLGQIMRNYEDSYCNFRNTRKNNNNLYGISYSSGGKMRSHHQCRRHSPCYRRKYPCGRI